LPPSDFNIYDFKTFFINHPDKKGKGMDEAYKMIDWEGYSFWKFEYDIYEGEGEKVHMCNNLLGGFLSRAEGVSKISFARHCVVGDEPNLQIYGVWLVRGKTEVPDGLTKDHPSFEYYRTRLLDPRNNKDDDKLVRGRWHAGSWWHAADAAALADAADDADAVGGEGWHGHGHARRD